MAKHDRLQLLVIVLTLLDLVSTAWTWISGSNQPLTTFFDPGPKNVTQRDSYTGGMAYETAFIFEGRYYITGGFINNGNSDNIWSFNPKDFSWIWYGTI
jgi:hypothetical protein